MTRLYGLERGGWTGRGCEELAVRSRVSVFCRYGKNTSFAVDAHFSSFIERQLEDGRYTSASDVVEAGLRLLEAEELRLGACVRP